MNAKSKFVLAAMLAIGVAGAAHAQSVASALESGDVGEQADGYLGVAGSVPAGVRAQVEQINIKRRDAYTALAAKRGVTVQEAAASVGCQALTRLRDGQAYRIAGGWQKKSGSVALPAYCS